MCIAREKNDEASNGHCNHLRRSGTFAGFVSARPVGGGKASSGHLMQEWGSVPGHHGASEYAPGHLRKTKLCRHRDEVRVMPNVVSYYR